MTSEYCHVAEVFFTTVGYRLGHILLWKITKKQVLMEFPLKNDIAQVHVEGNGHYQTVCFPSSNHNTRLNLSFIQPWAYCAIISLKSPWQLVRFPLS